MLNLFGRWIMADGIEKEIALRQLPVKSSTELSWFNNIKVLLNKYNLPLPNKYNLPLLELLITQKYSNKDKMEADG